MISVVIIAWRVGAGLVDAIASVVESVDAPDFEVVVVLNGASSDVRETFTAAIHGAVVVDLPGNTGYGFAANAGARVARGSFLLFLNDDARLAPDALRALVDSAGQPLEEGTPIGAVASLLLNGDGSVQEAGSRVFADAGTMQFGSGMSVSAAEAAGLLRRRRIDYGSGAALLVPTELFRSLGGHDSRYRPAYFEDVDLAFRIRASGADVVFEPAAVATHASGASTDTDMRFREFAADRAGRAFLDKWSTVLQNAATSDDPVGVVCPIPLSNDPDPVALQIADDPFSVALSVHVHYEEWLNGRLDKSLAAQDELDRRLLDAVQESAKWEALASERGEIAHERHELAERYSRELAEWRNRNIFQLARVRLSVAKRRLARLRERSGRARP
nr:glycosyltransferase [Agromyces sp. LHK192]